MKPIHKLNSGMGGTLCYRCRKIISIGFTEDLYCSENCKKEHTNGKKGNREKLHNERL